MVKLADLVTLSANIDKNIPIEFLNRTYCEPADLDEKTFTMDDAPIVRVKTRREKVNGEWVVKCSESGNPWLRTVAYIPLEVDGDKRVLVTTSKNITQLITRLAGETNGEPEDLPNGRVFKASEFIEGNLRIEYLDTSYGKDNYPAPALVTVE